MSATTTAAPRLEHQPSRGRRLVRPTATALGAAAFMLAVHVVDPNQAGTYPTCPWLAITGTYCPGCGSLRATHALAEGDLGTAVARNPLAVVAFAVMAVGFAGWTYRMWTGRQRRRMAPAWVLYAIFWGILAYWVARNIPGWTWLSPA